MKKGVSRVAWRDGQVLLPAHFESLEDSLASESAIRAEAHGLPTYGLLDLGWNGFAPPSGVVKIEHVRWVLRDRATVVSCPDGAQLPGGFDLGKSGESTAQVHLHLLDDPNDDSDLEEAAGRRGVKRVKPCLKLAGSASLEGSLDSIQLGSFSKSKDGWTLDPTWIPPTLRVMGTGYLSRHLDRLSKSLGSFSDILTRKMLTGESEQQRQGRRLLETRKIQALLSDLRRHDEDRKAQDDLIDPHPYVLFSALRELLFELHFPTILDAGGHRYEHNLLGARFSSLFGEIDRLVKSEPTDPVRLEFKPTHPGSRRVLECRDIPTHMFGDLILSLHVHKADAKVESPMKEVRLIGVHEPSPPNLSTYPGIRYELQTDKKVPDWVDVYRIDRAENPAEWEKVTRRGTMRLYGLALESTVRVYLHAESSVST